MHARTDGEAGDAPWPAARTAWYVVLVLTAANTLAFVDRQALALLVQPIKADLGISDTAMSLLYGISFTAFYVAVGVPIARLADRSNRRNIIVVSVFVWSLMTAACGLARTFPALLATRIGVGAGEGGLGPSVYSMLSDYFPKERLAAAIGVYQMGVYFGGAAALLIGGVLVSLVPPGETLMVPVLGAIKGWQLVFLALGAPGLLLGLVMCTVREPARRGAAKVEAAAPLSAFFQHLTRERRAYIGIIAGFALMVMVGNATGAWIPAFFERKFGWTTAEVGARYGLIVFFCGAGGALVGGLIASALRRRVGTRGNLLAAMAGFSVLVPVTIAFPLAPSAPLALGLIGLMNFSAGLNLGGGLATLQELTPNRMRALLSALYILAINIIGGGLGPLVVALIVDYGFADPQRLPEALAITAAVASPLAVAALAYGLLNLRPAPAAAEPQVA